MAINPNLVGVPAQSKNLDTATITTTAGLVHRQVISLADPETATNYARVSGGSLQVSVQNATLAVTQSGTFNITNISGTVSLPTGASTASLQTTGNTSLNSIDTKTPALSSGRVPVESNLVQGLTDTQLRASAVPVSAASLPLPSGASTSALQTTGNNSLSSIDGKLASLGQTTMVGSMPVVLASNHSNIITKKASSSYSHINTTGTTTVKSGSGILRRIVINTKGSSSNTLTVYDNTSGSGTTIAVIDTVNGVSGHFEYNAAFSTGLTIVNASGTSADFTVIYE